MLSADVAARLRAQLATDAAYTERELAGSLGGGGHTNQATVDEQLRVWQAQGLLRQRRSGAHAYWCLRDGGEAVAAPAMGANTPWRTPRLRALRQSRRCYGHLAGVLGVALLVALRRDKLVTAGGAADTWRFTPAGLAWCDRRGMHLNPKDAEAPGCLDGSERRDHLGGAAGRALLIYLLGRTWLRPGDVPRALVCTARGTRELLPWLRGAAPLPD